MVTAVPAVPLVAAQAALAKAMWEYLQLLRFRMDDWVRRKVTGVLPQQAALDLIAEEAERQTEFERRVMERVARDEVRIAALPEEERKAAIGKAVQRERVFARYRAEAMAVRAIAAIDRMVLQTESPTGAFWKLDPEVFRHTPDCVAMGGSFWPWEVLADFHPPTHSGCRCGLFGYRTAIQRGWMRPGDVQDLASARRRAAAARALLHEEELDEWEELREAVLRTGLADEATFTAAVGRVVLSKGSSCRTGRNGS
jgi:hypothetical protein